MNDNVSHCLLDLESLKICPYEGIICQCCVFIPQVAKKSINVALMVKAIMGFRDFSVVLHI